MTVATTASLRGYRNITGDISRPYTLILEHGMAPDAHGVLRLGLWCHGVTTEPYGVRAR